MEENLSIVRPNAPQALSRAGDLQVAHLGTWLTWGHQDGAPAQQVHWSPPLPVPCSQSAMHECLRFHKQCQRGQGSGSAKTPNLTVCLPREEE